MLGREFTSHAACDDGFTVGNVWEWTAGPGEATVTARPGIHAEARTANIGLRLVVMP